MIFPGSPMRVTVFVLFGEFVDCCGVPMTGRKDRFAERLAKIRSEHPGWDIQPTPRASIGWEAARAEVRLWAPWLAGLETMLTEWARQAPGWP